MSRRIHSLDTLRGLAALVVLANHLQHSFLPCLFGTNLPEAPGRLSMAPLSFLLNGSCAVALFFILSGFVLSERFLSSSKLDSLPDAVIRRWPRLAGPALVVNLLSGCLMGCGFYTNTIVADHNGAWWLKGLFNWSPLGIRDVFKAVWEGGGTFFSGHCSYNGPLWTMHYEFLGSMVVYFLAAAIVWSRRFLSFELLVVLLIPAYLRETIRYPFMACFILGVILACLYVRFPDLQWKNPMILIAGFAACVLTGGMTLQENDLPAFMTQMFVNQSSHDTTPLHYFLFSCVGLYFLGISLWFPPVHSFLSTPGMRILGRLSFPIYLVHTPVICCVGARVYLCLFSTSSLLASTAAIVASVVGTVALALPLAVFDDRWIGFVRRLRVRSLLRVKGAAS
jgi:peptidoglycan/LPS O-acetylase OafA/YrhL